MQRLLLLVLLALTAALACGKPHPETCAMNRISAPQKYFRLALLTVKDEALAHYIERLTPSAVDYGIAFARRVSPKEFFVKIAYFESEEDLPRFHRDPRHAHLEHWTYPASVGESIGVVGPALTHD